MLSQESHIIANWEKIFISPDLGKIFEFLIGIQKEADSLIEFEQKILKAKNAYKDLLWVITKMGKILEKNKIESSDVLKCDEGTTLTSSDLMQAVENFNFHLPIRAQFITLFAGLETVFCLHLAYEHATSDKNSIKSFSHDDKELRNFIDVFILSEENDFYKANKVMFTGISSKNLRELRNLLTHFFSVGDGIQIVPELGREHAKKLAKKIKGLWGGDLVFLTEVDFLWLFKGSANALLNRWLAEYQKDPVWFDCNIRFVKEIVDWSAANLIDMNTLSI